MLRISTKLDVNITSNVVVRVKFRSLGICKANKPVWFSILVVLPVPVSHFRKRGNKLARQSHFNIHLYLALNSLSQSVPVSRAEHNIPRGAVFNFEIVNVGNLSLVIRL